MSKYHWLVELEYCKNQLAKLRCRWTCCIHGSREGVVFSRAVSCIHIHHICDYLPCPIVICTLCFASNSRSIASTTLNNSFRSSLAFLRSEQHAMKDKTSAIVPETAEKANEAAAMVSDRLHGSGLWASKILLEREHSSQTTRGPRLTGKDKNRAGQGVCSAA